MRGCIDACIYARTEHEPTKQAPKKSERMQIYTRTQSSFLHLLTLSPLFSFSHSKLQASHERNKLEAAAQVLRRSPEFILAGKRKIKRAKERDGFKGRRIGRMEAKG